MSYTNDSADRTQDTEGTLKTFHLLLKDGEVYQVVMPPDADGDWGNSGASLVETDTADASATSVYEIRCSLDTTASANYWFCLVDKASDPANSDTIIDAIWVAPGGTATLSYPGGYPMSSGCGVCLSTTLTTVTLPGENVARFVWNVD